MKKTIVTLLLATSLVSLASCKQKEKSTVTSSTSTSTIKTTSSTKSSSSETKTSSSKEITSEERYAQVLNKYAKLQETNDIQSTFANANGEEVLVANSVAELFANGNSIQYSFYDIDKDGIEELLLGDKDFVSAIYTVNAQGVIFVKGAGMVGGLRTALSIHQDGHIIYSAGYTKDTEWSAELYQLKAGQLTQEATKTYTFGTGTDLAALFGITADKVDLSSLKWQTLKRQETSSSSTQSSSAQSLDIASIKAGDTASLVGTWNNGDGQTLEITADKKVISYGETYNFTIEPYPKDTHLMMITLDKDSMYGKTSYIIIPAQDSSFTENQLSNQQKDRLVLESSIAQAAVRESDWFYYRN